MLPKFQQKFLPELFIEEKIKMSRLKSYFSVYLTAAFIVFGFVASTEAQTKRDEREVRDTIASLNSKIDDIQFNLNYELRRASVSPTEENEIKQSLRDLKDNVSGFETNFRRKREVPDDVKNVLYAAKNVNEILSTNRFGSRIERDWISVRNLLDRLASRYQVSWNWNGGDLLDQRYPNDYPSTTTNGYGLTGTYRLDVSRSENPRQIADRAIQNNNIRRSGAREDLENRLDSPEQIAIDVRGNQVTLASSKSTPISFQADGQTRTETTGGRTIRVRASLQGEELTVSSLGGDTDYTVTFASIDNGRSMRVTRRFTTDYLRQTVFADSVYTKTDAVARLGINDGSYSDNSGGYSSNDPNDYPTSNPYPNTRNARTGEYIVPNGMMLTGILENEINTKVSQNNDRFRMTVQSPNQFRGAIIEGYISGIDRSGRVSGRSEITFNFERIRLRNGQFYDFAGYLQSVTDQNGKTIKVGEEGEAKGDSQTKETAKRGGIGAGIGAVIGAIAGGAKGAAIGAIIGGSAGAGSVIVQGRDDLELKQGSTVTVQSSSPIR